MSELLEIIIKNKVVNIKELFDLVDLSESTIRRRVNKLNDSGYINFSYGGKIEVIKNTELSLKDDIKLNIDRGLKRRISKISTNMIEDGDVIFVDNGTTVRYIIQALKNRDVTIYTNGYKHMDYMQGARCILKLIPGTVLLKEAAIVGSDAINFINSINFDYVFIGANGFDELNGVTTPNYEEMILKKSALENGDKSYFVVTSSKYKFVSKYKIAEFSKYPIITF